MVVLWDLMQYLEIGWRDEGRAGAQQSHSVAAGQACRRPPRAAIGPIGARSTRIKGVGVSIPSIQEGGGGGLISCHCSAPIIRNDH